MFSRRFILLAGVVVTLNLALWFAGPGLAIRQAIVQQLLGPKMIRAEVYEKALIGGSTDWRFDRGAILSVTSTELTLKEADGRIQPIPVSASTKVIRLGRQLPLSALAPRWHVLVTWPATGAPALSVDVERVPQGRTTTGFGASTSPGSRLS